MSVTRIREHPAARSTCTIKRQGDGVDRHGHRLQHCCFLEGKIRGQAVDDSRRNGNKLCKSPGPAIVGARNSQNLPVVAEIYFSAPAVAASATVDCRIERDSISFRKSRHSRPDRGDFSGCLVAHDDGGNAPARGAVVAVNVAPADPASGHTHQDFVRLGPWHGQISHFQMLILRKQESFHRSVADSFKHIHSLPCSQIL